MPPDPNNEPRRLAEARQFMFDALGLVSAEYNERFVKDLSRPDGIKNAEDKLRSALDSLNAVRGRPVGDIPF